MEPGTLVGIVLGLLIGAIILVVLGLILQWLWNSTLPDVLGVNKVSTWQAIKIMFIASILFGGHRAIETSDTAVGLDNETTGLAVPD